MSTSRRLRGIRILKAVSSPLRLQILNLLFDRGPLSYTELMSSLKMNPSREAGRFAYHLKFLLKADLIEAVVDQKKYSLTELGRMVIDVADRIDKKAAKPKSMLVRASRSAIEEFDANRIAQTLTKEARMPPELAQKVAKEAESQLLKSKTKYMTTPLVREVVNAILIEKGLEEYRHKLTRLGTPVHDVANLLKTTQVQKTSPIEAAGMTVFKEYTLLNVLPRDIADAHLSGAIHIQNLSTWLLKPTETIHDIRFFLLKGLDLEKIDPTQSSQTPPQTFEAALETLFSVILHSGRETETTQTLEYFNTFLAPYTRGMEPERIRQELRLFLAKLSQHTDTAISIELTTPGFLNAKTAPGPQGEQPANYADYTEETQQLASLLLEAFAEETARKPLLNPKLIIKIRPQTLKEPRAKDLLFEAHALAASSGTPCFANLTEKNHEQTVYTPSGFKLDVEADGDWEIDTLRTGRLGTVTVNVPRAAIESGHEKTKFFENLTERLEMASRALEIKHQALKQHFKNLLPFLTQSSNGDKYFRLEKCPYTVNLAGFTEAAETFTGKGVDDEETKAFAVETAQTIVSFMNRIRKKHGRRLQPATLSEPEAQVRLAQLDIERYGIARVHIQGTRDRPHYSTTTIIALPETLQKPQNTEYETLQLHGGGNLTVVELDDASPEPEHLLATTMRLIETHNIEILTYNRKATYCTNCRKTWPGIKHKCPNCNSVGTLTYFDKNKQT